MTDSKLCPLCTAALGEPKAVEVCTHCYAGLQSSPPVALSTTGEFPAIADPTMSAPEPMLRSASSANAADSTCCWCSKGADAVKKLLSQGDYHICNECVALCSDILRMELGDDFG